MLEAPAIHAPVPGIDKLVEVERIIRDATWEGETPMSLNEVKRRMSIANPRHGQVRDLVNLLAHLGRITETPKGVEYTYLDATFRRSLDLVEL